MSVSERAAVQSLPPRPAEWLMQYHGGMGPDDLLRRAARRGET